MPASFNDTSSPVSNPPVRNLLFAAVLFLILVSFTSCIKDKLNAQFAYNGAFAAPVAKVAFTLGDALKGDTLLEIGTDNSIALSVRQENLIDIKAADYLDKITGDIDETVSFESTRGIVRLDDIEETLSVTLDEFVEDFQDTSIRNLFIQNNGSFETVPGFQFNLNSELTTVSFEEFNWLNIETAKVKLTFQHNVFVDANNITVTIIDATFNQTIGTLYFDSVPRNIPVTQELALSGLTIGKSFKVFLNSFGSPGSGSVPVLIDLTKQIDVTLEVTDAYASAGDSKIGNNSISRDTLLLDLQPDDGEKISLVKVNTVLAEADITSTINTPMRVRLFFPGIYRNNTNVTDEFTLNPTAPGAPFKKNFDFSATSWYFDQNPDQPWNKMKVFYETFPEGNSDDYIQFSATDKVAVSMRVHNFDVEEVRGYFGHRVEPLDAGALDLDLNFSFINPQSTPILFDNPTASIEVNNSFGMPFQVDFDMQAKGLNGAQASLNPPVLNFDYPSAQETGQTKQTLIQLNKFNSDIVNFLSVYPEVLTYSGSATVNPDDDQQEVNFIRQDSRLSASATFDLPFAFRIEDLVFRDTANGIDLDFGDYLTLEDIDTAELKIAYINGLPLHSTVNLIALAKNGAESVITDNIAMPAASVDNTGAVPTGGEAQGDVFVALSYDQLLRLDEADKLILEVHFQSPDNGSKLARMYSSYRMDIKTGVKLILKI
ncbi:MAG: hypothetical protein ACK5Q2_02260 [Bacteroidota bacterium]